jgi:hypothetical protein
MSFMAGLCLLAQAGAAHAADAAAAAAELKGYLPQGASFAAEYVVIEPDPNFDIHVKRFRAAQEANREWFAAYRAKYAGKELPYHPNFGVPEADFVRYQLAVNHFREVSRQRIRVDRRATGSTVNLRLLGEKLLLNELQIEPDLPAARTSRGALAFREVVNLERASVPPAVHQGISFGTPDAVMATGKFRESVLLGRLKGTSTGILHYSLSTPGRVDMAYVVYPLGN